MNLQLFGTTPISQRLKTLIEKPDDLSDLPKLVEDVTALETSLSSAETKVGELHELNRKYLGMIPIKDELEVEKTEPAGPTPDDAVQEILEKWKG